MAEFFEVAKDWFLGLGEQYGVNPIIFGSIYVGAIPFFTLSLGWLVKNYRKGKSIVIPALSTTFFFISDHSREECSMVGVCRSSTFGSRWCLFNLTKDPEKS